MNWKDRVNGFCIGQEVRLKIYSPYPDYRRHAYEIGKIVGTVKRNESNFQWEVEWKDGDKSYVTETNMEAV